MSVLRPWLQVRFGVGLRLGLGFALAPWLQVRVGARANPAPTPNPTPTLHFTLTLTLTLTLALTLALTRHARLMAHERVCAQAAAAGEP